MRNFHYSYVSVILFCTKAWIRIHVWRRCVHLARRVNNSEIFFWETSPISHWRLQWVSTRFSFFSSSVLKNCNTYMLRGHFWSKMSKMKKYLQDISWVFSKKNHILKCLYVARVSFMDTSCKSHKLVILPKRRQNGEFFLKGDIENVLTQMLDPI